jgi:predicted ATPase
VTLRSVVSRLRTGPLRPHLTGGRGGYALDVAPDDVDVVRLRTALRQAEGRERFGMLERLERAWTGRALAGAGDAPFVRRETERLRDEHAAAMEELAGLRIEHGDDDDAVATLRDLVRRDPDAARPVALLATALTRGGREVEALRTIDDLGARLRDAAGLDLPDDLVALRTAILRREVAEQPDRPEPDRHGVPLPITGFVGRRAELAAVQDARARSRLVTVLGPGGVGKTRLAIEAARRDAGRDGRQVFLDLVPFTDAAGAIAALAGLVGALRSDLDAIVAVLRGTPTLLVLDNAEHMREVVAALVTELLARCDGLTVLVTSRDALRVPGERRVAIEPLLGDALSDAVELFAARAADIDPDFMLDERTAPLVRELVAAVDGVPLALELAAGRLPTRTLGELVAEVRERGTVGRPGGRGRHASVTAMIEWSTDLLTPPERELLVQLAGFAGAFSREAAVAICVVEGSDVDDLLLELVDRSLVSTSRTGDGVLEYRLLIAVRQVARRLCDRDRSAWRTRHRRWHADLVDRLRPALYSAGEVAATAVLERTLNDLSAAVEDAILVGDRDAALRITGGLARVWYRRGALADGVARIDAALAIPGVAAPIVEARAHLGLGLMRFFMRDLAPCRAAIAAAVAAAREAGAPSILALSLAFRGYLAGSLGDADGARASLAEAGGIPGVSDAAAATVEMIAADLARVAGAPATALAGLERAHRRARRAGESWVVTLTVHITAKVLIASRRGQEAIDLLVPVVQRSWDDGRPTHTIAGLVLVAAAAASIERHAVGARLLAAVDAQARRYSWEPDATDPEGNARHRARLREALTADEWRAEQTAGLTLGLAEAIALAAELMTPGRRRILAA